MANPWLSIDLQVYETHMSAANVLQAPMLASNLHELVEVYQPSSLCILGVAGGNGLQGIAHSVKKVIAVDINPLYLRACFERHHGDFEEFDTLLWDLSRGAPRISPVDLVYAALVLEYVKGDGLIAELAALLNPGGLAAFVFQNPGSRVSAVTETGIESVKQLSAIHSYVSANHVITALQDQGLAIEDHSQRSVAGKQFTFLTCRNVS